MFRIATEVDLDRFKRDEDLPMLCRGRELQKEFITIMKKNGIPTVSSTTFFNEDTCLYSDGCYSSLEYAMDNHSDKIIEFVGFKNNANTMEKLKMLREW